MHDDHYRVLGIQVDADIAAVRAAYLRVMREHHPDRRPGDPRATETARRANAAWEVLSDSARRASYDRVARPGAGARRPALVHVAYSPERHRARRAVHAAAFRAAAAVVAAGALVLMAVG